MQNSLWRQIGNRPMSLTSSVMRQSVSNFRLYCSKIFQMLRKNVKSLLEQLQVCIFAEIVFGVRCTLTLGDLWPSSSLSKHRQDTFRFGLDYPACVCRSSEVHTVFSRLLYPSINQGIWKSFGTWHDRKCEISTSYCTRLCISSYHRPSAKTTRFTNRKLIKAKLKM